KRRRRCGLRAIALPLRQAAAPRSSLFRIDLARRASGARFLRRLIAPAILRMLRPGESAPEDEMQYQLISADSHFIEPPNLWKDWLPKKYQEIAPRLTKDAEGGDAWDYGAGEPSPLGIYAAAGKNEHQLKWTGVTYETMNQGFYKGEPRLKEQDADGVDAEVIFSSGRMLGHFYRMKDDQAQLAGIEALNNWIFQEFVKPNPNRLIGLGYIPAIGAAQAAQELERVRKLGAKGVAIVC